MVGCAAVGVFSVLGAEPSSSEKKKPEPWFIIVQTRRRRKRNLSSKLEAYLSLFLRLNTGKGDSNIINSWHPKWMGYECEFARELASHICSVILLGGSGV